MVDVERLIKKVKKFPVLYDQSDDKYRNSDYKDKIWNMIAANLGVEGRAEECKKKWSSVRDQLRRTVQKRKKLSGPAKKRKYKYEDNLSFLLVHLSERDSSTSVPKLEDQDVVFEVDGQDLDDNDDNDDNDDFDYDYMEYSGNKEALKEEPLDESPIDGEKMTDDDEDTGKDNNFWSPLPGEVSGIQHTGVKQKITAKRKMGENTLESPSRQLMAYILEQKQNNKNSTQLHQVDAFLSGIAPSLKILNPVLWNDAKRRIFLLVQDLEMKQLELSGNVLPGPS